MVYVVHIDHEHPQNIPSLKLTAKAPENAGVGFLMSFLLKPGLSTQVRAVSLGNFEPSHYYPPRSLKKTPRSNRRSWSEWYDWAMYWHPQRFESPGGFVCVVPCGPGPLSPRFVRWSFVLGVGWVICWNPQKWLVEWCWMYFFVLMGSVSCCRCLWSRIHTRKGLLSETSLVKEKISTLHLLGKEVLPKRNYVYKEKK